MPNTQRFVGTDAADPDIPDTTALELWFRGDKGRTMSGSDVTDWADQSGNGRDVSDDGDSGRSPTLISAAVNGKDALDFDGVGNLLTTSTFPSIGTVLHLFLAFRQNSWTSSDRLVHLNPAGNAVVQSPSTPQISHNGGGGANNPVSATLNTWYLLQTVWNGAGSYQKLNDGAPSAGTVTAIDGTVLWLGGFVSAVFADITVAEAAVYSVEKTGGGLTTLEDYFNTRYSLW